jgi:glycosyltransferase involved in cell wall biosynthesis
MKKAGIYDPYLNTLGGGERYVMTVAEYLLTKRWRVDIFWNDVRIKQKIIQRLRLKIELANFLPNIFQKSIWEKYKILKNYDLIFYLSDGSVPFLFAKKNILHFQVPFHGIDGKNFLNRIKLKKIDFIVCNSHFTKKFIDKEYGVKSLVVYPPVAIEEFKPGKKENIILSVARFTDILHSKRQDVLVEVFKRMVDKGLKGWRLFLVGGDAEGKKLVAKLKKESQGYPIEILTNISFEELKKVYAKAKIFWHAAGYGIDERRQPEKVEHFGISVVEAIAAGCIPVVIGKGGIKEIITSGKNGFFWQTKEELENLTFQLIKEDSLIKKISQHLNKSSERFSKEFFCQKIYELVKD